VIVDSIVKDGPSNQIAYFATYHAGWSSTDEDRVVSAERAYLRPSGVAPAQNAAAYPLLRFILYVPNHAWPVDPERKADADAKVLDAAPSMIEAGETHAVQELARYPWSMSSSSDRAHDLLVQIATRHDSAGEQARIALRRVQEPHDP